MNMECNYVIYRSIDTKNIMHGYLVSSEFKTPKEKEVIKIEVCIKTVLFWYANELKSMTMVPRDNTNKKILVQLFHSKYVWTCKSVGKKYS